MTHLLILIACVIGFIGSFKGLRYDWRYKTLYATTMLATGVLGFSMAKVLLR